MRRLLTFICLLFSTALMAQGQLYNSGRLYVSPGTLMTAESDFINDTAGTYHNDGVVLLKGNFSNSGTAGFLEQGGLTRFEGAEVQKISGDKQVAYYNVLFKNSSAQYAFQLSDTMDIFGQADFTQGIVDNKNFPGLVVFEAGATPVNTSDESYVEGKVNRNGNSDFIYPVGKQGYYRPAATLLAGSGETHFSGEYYLQNSGLLYDHSSKEANIAFIDDKEYWRIGEKDGKKDSVLVRLKWRDATTAPAILDVAENGSNDYKVVVVHWDSTARKWVSEGGIMNLATRTVTSDTVSGYDVFALGLLHLNFYMITGRVFNDANGMSNGKVDGEALNQDLGLYAVLADETGNVFAVSVVSTTDGSYSFSKVPKGTYTVILTTDNPAIGGTAPLASLPAGWENTGEHIGPGSGDDGNPDGTIQQLNIENDSVSDVNFGIRLDSRNFFIPNGFSPNGDGNNDTWKPYGNKIREVYLMVYNQYGQKLFETRNVNEGWDGTFKGKMQPVGVYVYYAKVTFLDGQTVTRKGSINLVR